MPLLDIRTVKHSAIYGADNHWTNQWRLSAPFGLDSSSARDLLIYVMELERQVHMDHVNYDYGIIIAGNEPGAVDDHKGDIVVRYGASANGFQATPAQPSLFKEALYIQKYANMGKVGRFFFFGCLDQGDYRNSRYGHIILTTGNRYTDIVSTWLPGLMENFGASLMVTRGMMGKGVSIANEPAYLLLCGGLSLKNASTRRQATNSSPGVAIWSGLAEKARLLALWRDQLNDWLAFNHDFVPVDARDNSVDILGQIKALASDIENYCKGPDNGDGTNGQPPMFRWAPDADQLLSIVTTIKEAIPHDIEQINQIQAYTFVDGQDYLTHEQLDEIAQKLEKYASALAELVPSDWLNPANVAPPE